MSARLAHTAFGPKFVKHLIAANQALDASGVPMTTLELMRIRASQINGCSGCLDMHTKEATAAGESALRLNLVATWREATVFTDAEKAALELTEKGTRIADGAGVSDEVWENAAKHYDEQQLGVLVEAIALINAFTRMNVITRQRGGEYRVGQFA